MSLLCEMFVALRGPSEKGLRVWLNACELQATALRILADSRRNPSIGYNISHDCIISHSFRRGQPAAAQARSSSDYGVLNIGDVRGALGAIGPLLD